MNKESAISKLIIYFLLIFSVCTFYSWFVLPPSEKIKLGLDLQGGSSFVVQVDEEDVALKLIESEQYKSINELTENDLKQQVKLVQEIAVDVIRERIDILGTSEPEIYPEGNSRIVVRIPGADTTTRSNAKLQIQKDAVLSFKLIHLESLKWINELKELGFVPEGFKLGDRKEIPGIYFIRDYDSLSDVDLNRDYYQKLKSFGNKPADFMLREELFSDGSTIFYPEFVERRVRISGEKIKTASVSYDEFNNTSISLEFTKEGEKTFTRVTDQFSPQNAGTTRRLAIILDNKLYSAPNITQAIYGGRAEITGSFSNQEARQLVNVLRAGSLPGRVEIVEERTVAPSLGQDSINSGIQALIYGALSVIIFMLLYYLSAGFIANLSLIMVAILLPVGMWISAGFLGVLSGSLEGGSVGLPTLTLYGIAGIVLTVGMAVDANVLIFERMREEWKVGKSIPGSIDAGYNKAFSTILDANITTLLIAIILFWQGSGPIRGFSVTLSAGILATMFVVLILTKSIFIKLGKSNILKSLKMLHIPFLKNPNFNILSGRLYAAILSVILIGYSWFIFSQKGQDNFGVDFTGGTVVTYSFDEKQNTEVVRSILEEAGYTSSKISYQKDISSDNEFLEVKIKDTGLDTENSINAIKSLKGNYQDIKNDIVGPEIGAELKKQGLKAILIALLGIIIYISLRFEFAFAVGACVAVIHDVMITIGIFCLLGNELTMPIIAALLTIVGYSVNDTIVVFDRIREDLQLSNVKLKNNSSEMIKSKNKINYKEIANIAINRTLSRTLLTSFTTLLTIIMLLIFGGGAVKEFAEALLIGILVGTYSSIFIATPVMLLWHKKNKTI